MNRIAAGTKHLGDAATYAFVLACVTSFVVAIEVVLSKRVC